MGNKVPPLIEELQIAREKVQNGLVMFSLYDSEDEKVIRLKNQLLSVDRTLNAVQRDQGSVIVSEYIKKINLKIKFASVYAFNNDNGLTITYLNHEFLNINSDYIKRLEIFFKHIELIEKNIIELDNKAIITFNKIKEYFNEKGFKISHTKPLGSSDILFSIQHPLFEDTFDQDIKYLISLSDEELINICNKHIPSIDFIELEARSKEVKKEFKSEIAKFHKLNLNIEDMEEITKELKTILKSYI